MTNKESVTYIGFVQDHSGSMRSNKELAVTNFNEQRAKLLKEDDATMDSLVTIVEFDDQIHCNIENVPIAELEEMKQWWTGGMTALYDAIANCINNIKEKIKADGRQDKAALIVIQTDGWENASTDFAGEEGRLKINTMINELEDTKIWSFVFLGEGIDKEQVQNFAAGMGLKAGNIMAHSKANVATAYACSTEGLGDFMKMRKRGQTQSMNYFAGDSGNDNDSK